MSDKAPVRGFAKAEYEARLARAQAKMAQEDLAGLLVMTEAEVRYFTGFQTLFWQSPTRPWFVFVPVEGKPIAIIPEIGQPLMAQSWITDIRTWSAPNPEDDGISLLTELLRPYATSGQKIGIPKGHETSLRMPLADYEAVIAALPGLVIKDATLIIQALRMVKSAAEIEKIRHICAIGSAAFADVPQIAEKGMPFDELFRAFRIRTLGHGADDVPYLVGGAGRGGYHDVISPPSARALQTGDVFMLDTGAVWDGYYCDFDRNFAIGAADDRAKHAYDVLWRATERGLSEAVPGQTCKGLFAAMAEITKQLDPSGGEIGRFGHGLGMQLTEQPSHASFDHTILEPGMVLTLEPSLSYGDHLIMVHEENILITEHGAELLTMRAAPSLPIL